MKYQVTLVSVKDRIRCIRAVRDFLHISGPEAKVIIDSLPFRFRDCKAFEDDYWINHFWANRITQIFHDIGNLRIETKMEREDILATERERKYRDAVEWYNTLTDEDKARVDFLITRAIPVAARILHEVT